MKYLAELETLDAAQTAARNTHDYAQFMNKIADGHIAVASDAVL